jgi:hypothetical protein
MVMDRRATDDQAVLWLGYSALSAECADVAAILQYQQAWDRRIAQAFGRVPPGVRCVVLLEDGRALPARRPLDDLHTQWIAWKSRSDS